MSHACWPHRTLHTDRLLWLINLPQYDMIIGKGADTCHIELTKWRLLVQHGKILLRKTFLILGSDSSSTGRHTDCFGLWSHSAASEEWGAETNDKWFFSYSSGPSESIKWWWKTSYSYPGNLRSSGLPLNLLWLRGETAFPIIDCSWCFFTTEGFIEHFFWPYPEFWLELFDYLFSPIHSSDKSSSPFDPCSKTQQLFAATCHISARANRN